jgi:type IV pilus assembly protein PilQ
MSFLIVALPLLGAYPQEGIISSVGAEADMAVIGPEAPYVKPGNVTVNFKNADIRAVLRYLSEVSGVDIVPSPDVAGSVTLSLTDKPWAVALNIIVKNYGYAYEREGDIIRIVTLSSLKLEELSTEVIPLNYATAESARDAVKDMLTERGKLTYDARMNALVVTDLATNIYKIKQVIYELDKRTPQIMIEAKIIETTLSDREKLGIDWNLIIAASGAARPTTFPFANEMFRDILPHALRRFFPIGQTGTAGITANAGGQVSSQTLSAFPDEGGIGGTALFPFVDTDQFAFGTLDFSQFRAVLEYLDARSDTDIISNPRITTLNNKSAKMFVGQVYNYISEVEQKEEIAGAERWTYTIDQEEIGIKLVVTPHINDAGDVEVELKPEIKEVIGSQQVTEFFSLPIFTTREAETQVIVRDGETIFIGGLIKDRIIKTDKRFPILGHILGDIPFIGHVFKHTEDTKEKTELVFFLTVHVVKDLREFNQLAASGIKGAMKVLAENMEKEGVLPNEVFVELPGAGGTPALKKNKKPIFDLRKKKR